MGGSQPAGALHHLSSGTRTADGRFGRRGHPRLHPEAGSRGKETREAYNNNYQIFQSPDYVAILTEEIHETRIIPLDGRPHIPGDIRLWFGDSRGRWEGDSLVVETTNLMDHYDFVLTNGLILQDENARIVERFTRVGPDTIEYQFTVHDPTTYTSPWTAVIPMQRNPGLLYEYACHEGNYSLTHMLGGARADERARSESR